MIDNIMKRFQPSRCLAYFTLAVAAVMPAAFGAQASATTGNLAGRVSNQATNQYLGEAEVLLEGTTYRALTDRDGSYTLLNVKPGTYTAAVSYAGLDSQKQTVTVSAGQNVAQDFALTAGIYKLGAFVVASEIEGNAAQVNKQKKADYFMTAISADMLGEVPEGNIGEFLKYVPGLLVNYSNADAATVSVRGQDPEATLFTIDGQTPAAAGSPPRSSTGSSDASSRAFEFTQASINNIESVEVYKAPPPWMAPSTGGVINAVTKNAFDQKRRVFRTVLLINANSEMLTFKDVAGPGTRPTNRLKPGASVVYSEAFLRNTLGLTFSYAETNNINPSHNNGVGYTALATGTTAAPLTDAEPVRLDTFTLVDGPQVKFRRNGSLRADYKLGARTVLNAGFTYNGYLSQNRSHTFRLRPITTGTSQSTLLPSASATDTTVQNGQVDVFADYSDYTSANFSYNLGLRHTLGRWRLDATANYSKSDSKVADLPEMIQSAQWNLIPSKGVTYRIQGTPDRAAPTNLTQLAGPDLYNLNSYDQSSFGLQTSPRFQNDRTINLKTDLRGNFAEWRFPVEFRSGAGLYRIQRRKAAGQIVLDFRGPDGIAASGDELINAASFADTTYGDKFLFGIKTPPLIDPYKVAAYMRQYPNAFQDIQPTNVQRQAVNSQSITQVITSAYTSATVKITNRLTLLLGVRAEQTENFARGAVRKTSLGTGLVTNSKPWFQAIYSQTQRATSDYLDYFPNSQLTYRFTPDLVFRIASTRSMSRPGVQTILPNTTVNDTAAIPNISINNTALTPQYSQNLDAELQYFTASAGVLSVGWFRKNIKDYIINEQTYVEPGDDNGFDGAYAGYVLNTQENGGKGFFEGLEISGRQPLKPYLKALPQAIQGVEVFVNYTKNYKGQAPNRQGLIVKPTVANNFYDWNASYGVSYATPARGFYLQARTEIKPSGYRTAQGASTTDLRRQIEARHQRWDFTMRYRFNRSYALELTGSNILKDPSLKTYLSGRLLTRRDFGASYVLSFTANLDAIKLPFLDRN
jgi:iron complex outermembrane recepter protein